MAFILRNLFAHILSFTAIKYHFQSEYFCVYTLEMLFSSAIDSTLANFTEEIIWYQLFINWHGFLNSFVVNWPSTWMNHANQERRNCR